MEDSTQMDWLGGQKVIYITSNNNLDFNIIWFVDMYVYYITYE